MTKAARYGAFISYSHAASADVASGLQKWLQTYAKPWWRPRAIDVFRDQTNLTAAPALWSRIADALDQSSHFILLASPEAAQSKWIKREIRYWLGDSNASALNGPDLDAPMSNPKPERVATLLIALTGGDISWDEKAGKAGDFDWSKTSALPRQLSGVFSEEPQWVDLKTVVEREHLRASLSRSNAEFMRAVAQLAAPIRGISDFSRLVSEDYRQYRRTIRTAWAAAGALAVFAVAATSLGLVAYYQRQRAVAELREAQIEQSRVLAGQASGVRETGDAGTAVLLALSGLPDAQAGIDRPDVPEAEGQLGASWRDLRERLNLVHDDWVASAAFSPDGKRIVTASHDKTARLWDAATGLPIGQPLKGHEGAVNSAAFSPDGMRVVTASDDGTARLWDATTGGPIGEPLRGHVGPVSSAAFSPDGKLIVTAGDDRTARLWDALSGRPAGEPLKGHEGPVISAAFSPDGMRVVTASDDRTARLWNTATSRPIGEPLRGHILSVLSAAFSPDGKVIVTAGKDRTVRLWDATTGQPIGNWLSGYDDTIESVAFSPDGKRIVTASDDGTARLWDPATRQQIGKPLRGHQDIVFRAAFSPDGQRIVTASRDRNGASLGRGHRPVSQRPR